MRRTYKGKENPNYKGKNSWESVERECPNCKDRFTITRHKLLYGKSKNIFCSRVCISRYTKISHPEKYKGKRVMDGYIYLLLPDHPNANSDNYYAEHRYIMEKHIGRVLRKDEVVHHKNRVRNDNRIENLELLSSNIAHREAHAKDLHEATMKYWTPERRKEMSEKVIAYRKRKFWSTKQL